MSQNQNSAPNSFGGKIADVFDRILQILRVSLLISSPLILAFLAGGWVLESPEPEAAAFRKKLFSVFPIARFASSQSAVSKALDLQESDDAEVVPKDPVFQAQSLGASMAFDTIKRFDPEGDIESYNFPGFTREDLLNDRDQRVPEEFKIPASLRLRVGFWLDIYTRYGSYIHVIHHAKYPWIILAKVDTAPIYSGAGHKWSKYHRAKALVENTKKNIRLSLRRLAQNQNPARLNDRDRAIADLLTYIPGPRKKVYAEAAALMRSQLGQRDFYRYGLVSASKYIPMMEDIFAKYDLPVELTRLPLVESSFNEEAISKVGASGIWQFMPSVGRVFLRVGETFDERNSPVKSSEAAAKLLLQNFRILKSWPLALTAYNHGPGGLIKASKVVGTNDLSQIIQKYRSKSFSFASSNFYCEFLAALHAERYQDEVFGEMAKYPVLRTEGYRLPKTLTVKSLAALAGLTLEQIRLYNPDLKRDAIRRNVSLPKGYFVHLPEVVIERMKIASQEVKTSAEPLVLARNLAKPAPLVKKSVLSAKKSLVVSRQKSTKLERQRLSALKTRIARAEPPKKTRVRVDFQQPRRESVSFDEDEGSVVTRGRNSRDL